MPFNIAGLVENITKSVRDFITPRDPGAGLYPSTGALAQALSQVEKTNWNKSLPYVFAVQDSTGTLNGGFKDFPLPINPTDLNQDENFAISVKATQGGTVVQHSGNRYMELSISGTTGVHPFKGSGGANAQGQAILQPNDMKYQSGYYVFQQLRNWFRAYYEFKKQQKEEAADLRLIFKNFKDGEFLIVELLRFTTKRNASRPFMYDYALNFKVIGRVDQRPSSLSSLQKLDRILNDAFDKIDTARGVFLRSQDILRQVEANVENTIVEPLRRVNLALKALLGIPTTAADMGSRLISQFTTAATAFAILTHIKNSQTQTNRGANTSAGSSSSQISNVAQRSAVTLNRGAGGGNTGGFFGGTPALAQAGAFSNVTLPSNLESAVSNDPTGVILGLKDALMNVPVSFFPTAALSELSQDQANSAVEPRSYFEQIITDLERVRDNAADKYNLSSAEYNAHFRRTVTVTPDSSTIVSDEEFAVLGAFNLAIKAIYALLNSQTLFNTTYAQRIASIQQEFNNRLSIKASQAVRQIRLPISTTLERLAQQELGDSSRWPEIVELNDLKPPYIVQDLSDTSEQVLHPGDPILLPAPVINGFGNVTTLKEMPINQGLSQAERALGIDIALTKDFDLSLTNLNDFQVVKGAQNAAQAIILKLFYERGDLLKHPEIGVGIKIGSKGDPLGEIKSQIISSLTADSRFESIKDLNLRREGDAMLVQFTAYVKNVDVPVPISLSL
jgi:hypothetical protein